MNVQIEPTGEGEEVESSSVSLFELFQGLDLYIHTAISSGSSAALAASIGTTKEILGHWEMFDRISHDSAIDPMTFAVK